LLMFNDFMRSQHQQFFMMAYRVPRSEVTSSADIVKTPETLKQNVKEKYHVNWANKQDAYLSDF